MFGKFDKIYCVTLKRRLDRWEEFKKGLPQDFEKEFGKVEKWLAYDGREVQPPSYWKGGGGSWGCYNSHKMAIENALQNDYEKILLMEDDAIFLPHFIEKAKAFLNCLPSDAEIIYLGGQHLKRNVKNPEKINQNVYRPYNVNRTHCWGIIGRQAMVKVLKHLNARNWTTPHHIDHWLGKLHESGRVNVYCPPKWIVDQREGRSDVAQREKKYTHWKDAEEKRPDGRNENFYAILGLHSSGSSALAGAIYCLGAHLGNRLVGYHGEPPIKGGEAFDLYKLFEKALPVPETEWQIEEGKIREALRAFVDSRRSEAITKGTVAAGKYPQMAAAAPLLLEYLGNKLKVIVSDRNREESKESLTRRFTRIEKQKIYNHQEYLGNCIEEICNKIAPENLLRINYNELLKNPGETLEKVVKFMKLKPTDEQMKRAVEYIKPEKKHVNYQS